MHVSAVIVAAGSGRRFGGETPKQFLTLGGRPVLAWAVGAFQRCEGVNDVILVTKEEYVDYCQREIVDRFALGKVRAVTAGGETRSDSVAAGLARCNRETNVVLVHDGARPFVTPGQIETVIDGTAKHGCCTLAAPVRDTVKACDADGNVLETLDRSLLWNAQTPQGFRFPLLAEAVARAREDGFTATDDCQLVERLGRPVRVIHGGYLNIKITMPEDFVCANAILNEFRKGEEE